MPHSPKVVFFLARGAFPNLSMVSCFPSQKGINEHTGPLSFPSAPICQQASVYSFSCLLTNTLAISNSNLTCSPLMAIQRSMPDREGCGGWELAWKTAWEGRQKKGTIEPWIHVNNTKPVLICLPFLPIFGRALPSTRPKRNCVSI